MGIKRWVLPQLDRDAALKLSKLTGMPEIICSVLAARGFTEPTEVTEFFLQPDDMDDPYDLIDMDKAVERIRQALEEEQSIAVYGDYDCDGITSTALLTSYLQSVGGNAFFYVPSREREGYGMNRNAVEELSKMKVDLIVTVDNGISAHDEILYAKSLGMDVVVTDHHTPRATLPQAVAVVNPHRKDCKSRFKGLAGVGVAFKLVCALEEAQGAELLEYYSDLVALGTIADIVPLVGENRTIVRHGLERLCESERPGIQALLDVAGVTGALSGESVAFGLAPRINAAGRMDCADDALELLLTDDVFYAKELAESLNKKNEERKKIEDLMLKDIEGILKENPQILTQRLLIISGKDWHHGVVGIAAAKLMERYGKPVILFSIDGEEARGSGRSIEGFSLIEAISACSSLLTQYGGHVMAAGLSLKASHLPAFVNAILDWARINHPYMPVAACHVAAVFPLEKLVIEEIQELSRLEPFGCENEQPLFLLKDLTVNGIFPTADKKHLRLRFISGTDNSSSKRDFYAVYFRMTEQDFPYRTGDQVDVIAALSVGEYNGKPQLSVRVRDIRLSGAEQDDLIAGQERYSCHIRQEYGGVFDAKIDLLPGREDLAVVYKYIKQVGSYAHGVEALYLRLANTGLDYCKMLIALDVLVEMGLINRMENPQGIQVVPNVTKVDLQQSKILQVLQQA